MCQTDVSKKKILSVTGVGFTVDSNAVTMSRTFWVHYNWETVLVQIVFVTMLRWCRLASYNSVPYTFRGQYHWRWRLSRILITVFLTVLPGCVLDYEYCWWHSLRQMLQTVFALRVAVFSLLFTKGRKRTHWNLHVYSFFFFFSYTHIYRA